ncbi:MAG: hypothetical protein EXR74_00485 [Bdellovibrionales bacterium]|nr:hypothetical protein [Bdellovibrionales bacterium]
MKVLFFILIISFGFSLRASESISDFSDSKLILTCTQLAQEDILRIKIIERNQHFFLVLEERDGETELLITDPPKNGRFILPLPFWRGQPRFLRPMGPYWLLSTCLSFRCDDIKIICK